MTYFRSLRPEEKPEIGDKITEDGLALREINSEEPLMERSNYRSAQQWEALLRSGESAGLTRVITDDELKVLHNEGKPLTKSFNEPREWTPEWLRQVLVTHWDEREYAVICRLHNAALAANDDKWRERFRQFEKIEDKFGPCLQRSETQASSGDAAQSMKYVLDNAQGSEQEDNSYVIERLEYIAESPTKEHGGFHEHAIHVAKDAIAEIRRLNAALAAERFGRGKLAKTFACL